VFPFCCPLKGSAAASLSGGALRPSCMQDDAELRKE
jgi:hypothetical protein